VPSHSARIVHVASSSNSRRGREHSDMVQNLLTPVRERLGRSVVRAGVHFVPHGSRISLDKLLGRRAHLQLIDSIDHLPMLLWPYRHHLL
jgi:hypothetical protein